MQSGDYEQRLREMNEKLLVASIRQQELTEHAQAAEAKLRDSEERLRLTAGRQAALIEGMPQLVWRAIDRGRWTWSSPQWSAYTGLSDEASRNHGWLDALHPQDREQTMAQWREAEDTGVFEAACRLRHVAKDGYRWFSTRAMPVRDDDGAIIEWLGTSTDIDDLRRLQDQQKVMVAELQHRTRNLIAVVRSISQQTMVRTGPGEAFRLQFNDRLAALARVQGLLSNANDERVTIGALIRMELDALGAKEIAGKITLQGPEVPLRSMVVQTLALALHELATNARKYGALATGDGLLSVSWTVQITDGDKRRLVLEWLEEGVDAGRKDWRSARGGYGRELIERALPFSLNARTSFELRESGVRCMIDLPLEMQMSSGTAKP